MHGNGYLHIPFNVIKGVKDTVGIEQRQVDRGEVDTRYWYGNLLVDQKLNYVFMKIIDAVRPTVSLYNNY